MWRREYHWLRVESLFRDGCPLLDRGAIAGVQCNGEPASEYRYRRTIIPNLDVHDALAPIPYLASLCLLAHHVAAQRGTDVEQPLGLAKSMTVEWFMTQIKRE